MKSIFNKLSLLALTLLLNYSAFTQSPSDVTMTFYKPDLKEITTDEVKPTISNELAILETIIEHLQTNLKWPGNIRAFYNSDVIVSVSFLVSGSGELEQIQVTDKRDKLFEDEVIETLNNLGQVNPIMENGEVIYKRYILPVVFSL